MKILIASLQCEGNSLTPIPSRLADFDYVKGEAVFEKLKDATAFFKENGCSLIPAVYARALPGGTIVKEDFERLTEDILRALDENEAPDGIWLYLHGAMHVENIGSGEQYVLKRVRERVGKDIPISLALDFHANNTDELPQLCNFITGYRTAPHSDREETQIRAAQKLIECIKEKMLPTPQLSRARVIICGDAVKTSAEPLRSIMKMARQMERTIPGLMSAEVFNGQSWVDEPYMCPTFVATHKTNPEIAKECAQKLARAFYDARYDFVIEHHETEKAIELAVKAKEKQVFLSDSGDNTTAGATGDNAYMLNRLTEAHVSGFLLAGITDAQAVDACDKAKVGDELTLKIGGKLDVRNETATVTGRLVRVADMVNYTGGKRIRAAVLDCGDKTVIITRERAALCRPDILDSIEPKWREYKIVVVKLGFLFPELERVSERTILAFTPGNSAQRLCDMHHTKISRPMFPLDDNFM